MTDLYAEALATFATLFGEAKSSGTEVEPNAMTLATVDRLVHHATIFEMNVESFRRRVAQKGLAPSEPRNPNTSKPKG